MMGVPTFQIRHIQRCRMRQSNCSLTVGFWLLVKGVGRLVSAIPAIPVSVARRWQERDQQSWQRKLPQQGCCWCERSLGLIAAQERDHVQDPSKRRRFGPNKLHCYLIPVLTRARFGEGLMVIPKASHFTTLFAAEVVYGNFFITWNDT